MTGWKETELTGRKRYRKTTFGLLILQVERRETFDGFMSNTGETTPSHGTTRKSWRDARIEDLTVIEK